MIVATHVALAIAGVERPEELQALHKCDNPACVNPTHLRWGTIAENVKERDERRPYQRRGLRGEKNSQAKLTEEQVREIRASPLSAIKAGKEFGVSHALICRIRNRQIWTHV